MSKEAIVANLSKTVSKTTWIFTAAALVVDIALLYKDWHLNRIDKKTFFKRAAIKITSTAAGVAGAASGASLGSVIGSCICPGWGTVIGAITGAIIGGFLCAATVEAKLEKILIRELDTKTKQNLERITTNDVYQSAIKELGLYEPTLSKEKLEQAKRDFALNHHPDKYREEGEKNHHQTIFIQKYQQYVIIKTYKGW